MVPIARHPASGAASSTSGTRWKQATPTSAETVFPPTTAQGWASGLLGTQNSSTAEAPIGAIR